MLNTDKLKAYGKLKLAIKKLEDKAGQLKEKASVMESSLVDHLIDEGFDKVSIRDGSGMIIYIHTQLWAKCPDKLKAIQALRDAGLGYMVEEGFNSNRLSAYLRELAQENKDLPKEFEGVISSSPVQKLMVKRR